MADSNGPKGGQPHVPWLLVALPGVVILYALVGALWHPVLLGTTDFDPFACDGPWAVVVLGAFVLGGLLMIIGLLQAVRPPRRPGGVLALSGALTVVGGFIVFGVTTAHDYHLRAS